MDRQAERRAWLIQALLAERGEGDAFSLPKTEREQKQVLRALLNLRPPVPAGEGFLRIQDEYLQEETRRKGVVALEDLEPIQRGIYLWQGDITTLKCGAVVNAANSRMLGCFVPGHMCIDNAIHTFAGVQLRLECAALMREQGHEEPAGKAKITGAYNLPCGRVLHTVGPVADGSVTRQNQEELAGCYLSCLELAEENAIKSVAFCCISTGVFRFPNRLAAEIAVKTVQGYRAKMRSETEVIFNVFTDRDYEIYQELLG